MGAVVGLVCPSWWIRQGQPVGLEDDMAISKFTATHTQLQAAGLANNITLFTLPAGAILEDVKIKHSTAFAGAGITAYTVSVGITGNLAKYASAFDVLQAVAATTMQVSSGTFTESHTATTAVKIAAESLGGNLDASTAGSVDVWVRYWVAT